MFGTRHQESIKVKAIQFFCAQIKLNTYLSS